MNLVDKIANHLNQQESYFSEDTQKRAIQAKAQSQLKEQIKTGEIEHEILKAALPDFEYNGEEELPVSKLISALNESK